MKTSENGGFLGHLSLSSQLHFISSSKELRYQSAKKQRFGRRSQYHNQSASFLAVRLRNISS